MWRPVTILAGHSPRRRDHERLRNRLLALRDEVADLEAAVGIIQIDEPALREGRYRCVAATGTPI